MNVCPKDAIYLDKDKHCHIDQEKCIKCGRCFNQCPYHAISKIERPCAAACGMDAIESDDLGRAKINYDKCVSCGMCLVNCPFAAIADKSQIFQVINAMNRAPRSSPAWRLPLWGQFGKAATPAKLKAAMRILGFQDVVEVAHRRGPVHGGGGQGLPGGGPGEAALHGHQLLPRLVRHGQEAVPGVQGLHLHALTPMVITAAW